MIRVPSDSVRATAVCSSNGVSVKFSLQSLASKPLRYTWYEDPHDGSPVTDVRITVDSVAVNVATDHAEKAGDKYNANNLGLLFYDAATRTRVERSAGTGIRELDSLLSPVIRGTAQST
jgi:hypothetical protein